MSGFGGLIAGAMAGLGGAVEDIGNKRLIALALQERDQALAEIQRGRDERQGREQEERQVRAEDRKRAPYREAQAATQRWKTENTTYDEASGTAVPREPDEASLNKRMRDELLGRGEHQAAHEISTEGLTREKLAVEKAGITRREGQEQRQHDERMEILNKQLLVQQRQLAHAFSLDKPQATALTTNIKFMVGNGIADDASAAFSMLRTKMEKSPEQVLEQITMNLLRGGDYRYRGKDGRSNAIKDARELLSKIRGADQAAFDDVFKEDNRGTAARRPLDAFMSGE